MTLFFLFIISLSSGAQNLIVNGGFDKWDSNSDRTWASDVIGKPVKGVAAGWEDFGFSPDYYHEEGNNHLYKLHQCGDKIGKGFLGFMNRGEVTGTQLITALEKDKEYLVTVYAQRPESSCPPGVAKLTVAFHANKLPKKSGTTLNLYTVPFITLYPPGKKAEKERCKWVEFSGVYKAKGGEAWFYLGDFRFAAPAVKPAKDSIVTDATMGQEECLYINCDSVVVKELSTKPFVLDGIYFETNKSTLLPTSFPALDKLFEYAQMTAGYKLKITGYTDNVGDKAKNMALSKQRAQAVVVYLEKKGIPKARLMAEGEGDTKPVADNGTEEGRAKNRRVEAALVK